MPFENFYQESDKARRRFWKGFGLAFLLFIGYWAFAPSALLDLESNRNLTEYTSTKEFNEKERARRVDDLCRYLPRPEQFDFISSYESAGFESSASFDSSTVIYRYKSERVADEIMPAFLIWFDENGWRLIPNTSTYEKGKQTVYISVSFDGGAFTQYEIYCAEKD